MLKERVDGHGAELAVHVRSETGERLLTVDQASRNAVSGPPAHELGT